MWLAVFLNISAQPYDWWSGLDHRPAGLTGPWGPRPTWCGTAILRRRFPTAYAYTRKTIMALPGA